MDRSPRAGKPQTYRLLLPSPGQKTDTPFETLEWGVRNHTHWSWRPIVLSALGLSTRDESVYRVMLANSQLGIVQVAEQLNLSEDQVREALDILIDLALVRSVFDDGTLRAVRPQ